jgi:hypothetical protein
MFSHAARDKRWELRRPAGFGDSLNEFAEIKIQAFELP